MPYPMIHLEVAYRLTKEFDWIEKMGDFLLGSVAPDAVHFHENYDVREKERSHIWDCGPIWGVTVESEKWKENVCSFWGQHKNDSERDFIAGYCVHLLTDWLNDLRMWAPFREKIMQGADYAEIYGQSQYRDEGYGFDKWLYQTDEHTKEIWELLEKGQVQGLPGCIAADDLARQKQSLLTEQYAGLKKYDISGYKYYTKEVIDDFMIESVELIKENMRL
ncbi:MAG: hypothetical protein NC434_04665 [Ruminococcus sp.]|nr:hypothetical protein [Ruminococcus sp.]